eukprot:gnl/TRDRNA2_/TRDRNA2_134581_c2_seq1.p1 gnl/TRDRNA2_/TRDRNA2_134581_c2~~gnl/TRDRNA2_/TRDRNA2_134581_c2_seq1.p1  ORF type:complete len:134 (-),score=13.28 gnl/TRDRNA2_/TRDRNA2_134581_c2_seq1:277-678(-)
MEHIQVLRYRKGEYYREHHDNIEPQHHQPCGRRVATFFIYLNDVEEGGETRFSALGLKVKPRKGRAVLWWNVRVGGLQKKKNYKLKGADVDKLRVDERLAHESIPVKKGEKWAANVWLHGHNFRGPFRANLLS